MKRLPWFVLVLVMSAGCRPAPPPALEILAGQPGGSGDAEGSGATVRLTNPCGLASDASGNLYVTNSGTHTLFRITAPMGQGTRVVGMPGTAGASDGPGRTALLNRPCGLAIAPNTNFLYLADTANSRIRRVNLATFDVSTVTGAAPGNADGPLATATFRGPEGIVAIDANTLYVTDTINHTIRRIDLASAEVITIAGAAGQAGSTDGVGTTARFNSPRGLAFSGTALYVADTANHTIRRIDLGTSQVSTIAGTPGMAGSTDGVGVAARFSIPNGLAVFGTTLAIADTGNHTIRLLTLGPDQVVTYAGQAGQAGSQDGVPAAARFNGPYGLVLLGQDTLYVADNQNHTVRAIVPQSASRVSTLAGAASAAGCQDGIGAQARLNSPRGDMVVDGNNLYFSDTRNHVLRSIDLGSRTVTTRAGTCGIAGSSNGSGSGQARFNTPFGLARRGRALYLADANNNAIRVVNLDTYEVTTLAGTGTPGAADGACLDAQFKGPRGLALASNDMLYVADADSSVIRQINLTTCTVTTLTGTAGNVGGNDGACAGAQFDFPRALALGAGDTLYVAEFGNCAVRAVNPPLSRGGCQVTTLAGVADMCDFRDGTGSGARFSDTAGIVSDGRGRLYVADETNGLLRAIDAGTRQVTTVVGAFQQGTIAPGALSQARIHNPWGLARGLDGTIYISDAAENVILAVRNL